MREEAIKKIEEFKEHIGAIEAIAHLLALADWDARVCMPKKGVDDRGQSMGYLATEIHKMSTDDKVKDFVEYFSKEEDLDEITTAMVREVTKSYEETIKIPAQWQTEYTILCSKAAVAWEEAKEKSDFEIFRPYLEKIKDMNLQYIDFIGYSDNKYNALLENFEKGITVEKLDKIFGQLRDAIVELLNKIKNSNVEIKDDFLKCYVSKEQQKELSNFVLGKMGFDYEAGRMDESVHPFTTNFGNKDVRITTHYYENDFADAMFSTIHEGGHALYEQDIPDYLKNTGLNGAASLGVHESQSRFNENIIGRSYSFCKYIYEYIKDKLPQLKDVSIEEFYKAINKVSPSLIRVSADELTYSLHIIIRYEIEKALINGEIEVKDLPRVWNEKYKEYIGVEPKNDAEGVLQDTHWANGTIGYFPSYALGNIYGAQFLNTMLKEIPDIYDQVEQGNLEVVHKWLKENIHIHGGIYTPADLVKKVTGEELNAKYFIEYLNKKYSQIYGF